MVYAQHVQNPNGVEVPCCGISHTRSVDEQQAQVKGGIARDRPKEDEGQTEETTNRNAMRRLSSRPSLHNKEKAFRNEGERNLASGKSANVIVAQGPPETAGHGEARNRKDGEKRRLRSKGAKKPNRPSEPSARRMMENEP